MKKIRKSLFCVAVILGMLISSCICQVFASSKTSLQSTQIKLSADKFVYNKKAQHPKVTITNSGKKLKENRDYTVRFPSGCKNIGSYTITISGKGKYTGKVKCKFQIIPQPTKFTSVVPLKVSNSYMLQVIWKKQTVQTKGYEVRYSTNSKMKGAKKAVIKSKNYNGIYIQNLKAGTNYYLQIRTYGTVKGKNYYSKWSSVKKCKILGGSQGTVPVKTPTPIPQPTKIPELKFEEGKETVKLEGRTRIYYYTSNKIKSVEISNHAVIYQFGEVFGNRSSFESLEPGKSTITFTDIYGQKITSTVTVTEKTSRYQNGSVVTVSTVVDNTMPKAVIHSTNRYWYYITLTCAGDESKKETYEGMEAYLSYKSNFEDYIQVAQGTRWQDGRGVGSFNNISGGSRCYIKARFYTVRGNVKVVGPWSKTMQIDMLSIFSPSKEKAKYTYEIYGLDKKHADFYSGETKPVYIKTNNPDADAFTIRYNNQSVLVNVRSGGDMHFYKDIVYEGDKYESSSLLKVKGGYLGHLCFDEPGSYKLEIREYSTKGYVVAGYVTINVRDYEQECLKWMQEIIDKNTTPDMTPFQKMDAVEAYLRTPGLFKYLTNYDNRLISLASEPNSPFFISYRWDSATSPSALCQFAKLIGGFDDIHNCYGDYTFGSSEWMLWHPKARLTIGKEVRYYVVCPMTPTGTVDINKIEKIDFSNVSKLRKFS